MADDPNQPGTMLPFDPDNPTMVAPVQPAPVEQPTPQLFGKPEDVKAAQDFYHQIYVNSGKSGTDLPPIYNKMATARASGLSWDDINGYINGKRDGLKAQGVSDNEIDAYMLGVPLAKANPGPITPNAGANAMGGVSAALGNFSERFLGPQQDLFQQAGLPRPGATAVDVAGKVGWNLLDFGKSFPKQFVDGLASIAELADGTPKSTFDKERLMFQSAPVLMALGGPLAEGGLVKGAAVMRNRGLASTFASELDKMNPVPTHQQFIDGAIGLTKDMPEGTTPDTLAKATKVLGDHYSTTGEDPVSAVTRAQQDPEAKAHLQTQMDKTEDQLEYEAALHRQQQWANDLGLDTTFSVDPEKFMGERKAGAAPLTVEQATDRLARPPLIGLGDAPTQGFFTRLLQEGKDTWAGALEDGGAMPGERKLLDAEVSKLPTDLQPPPDGIPFGETARALMRDETGAIPLQPLPQIDIQPSTLFERRPMTASILVHNLRAVFQADKVTADARVAAGIWRSNKSLGALSDLRRASLLSRFSNAFGNLSSDARRVWWHDYETGNLDAYEGTPLGAMSKELQRQTDLMHEKVEATGYSLGYIEHWLPRAFVDEKAAKAFMAKSPLAGSGRFTRERLYATLRAAEAAGLQLKSDNVLDVTHLALADQQRFVDVHNTFNEMAERGLVYSHHTGPVPDGLQRLDSYAIFGPAGHPEFGHGIYAEENVARLVNRYISDSAFNQPLFNAMRMVTSAGVQMKVLIDQFHPISLALTNMAMTAGDGVRGLVGGLMHGDINEFGRGIQKVMTFPASPIQAAARGLRIMQGAKTGLIHPEDAPMIVGLIAGGARFGSGLQEQFSGMGGFWQALHGSVDPSTGYATLSQELAQMVRDAKPMQIAGHTVAPGYLVALAHVIPRVLDTIRAPFMSGVVPALKVGTHAQKLAEAMKLYPSMGLDDMRFISGRIGDHVDNAMGEMVRDNLPWNKTMQDLTGLLANFPSWTYGKLRLLGGTVADTLLHGGLQEGVNGSKEVSQNLSLLVGVIATTAMFSTGYGLMNGTYNSNWTWKDYMSPLNSLGQRVILPGLQRYYYNWIVKPEQSAMNQINWVAQTLHELGNNRQFDGATAIFDKTATTIEQSKEFGKYMWDTLKPLAFGKQDDNLTLLDKVFSIGKGPYELRKSGAAEKYEEREKNTAIKRLHKQEQR